MTGPNDFYVRFDSNAKAWASQLQTQLQPAKNEILLMQGMINALDRSASSLQGKLGKKLAAGAGNSVGGAAESKAFVDNINKASDELSSMIRTLAQAVEGLKQLPTVVANARRGIAASENNARQIAAGQGRSYNPGQSGFARGGSVQIGSELHGVLQTVRKAASAGMLSSGAVSGRAIPPASAGSVTRSDITNAMADRIVRAIEQQTRELKAGIEVSGRVSGAATNTVSGKRGKKGAAAQAVDQVSEGLTESEADLEKRVSRLKGDLGEIGSMIEQLVDVVARTGSQEAQAALDSLRTKRSALAAEAAKLEREATGVTRGAQSQRRKEEFAAQQGPTLSEAEHLRRLGIRDLVNAPAGGDFLARATSRGKSSFTKEQLRQIIGAFGSPEIGLDTGKLPTRMSQEQLAQRALDLRSQYDKIYQGSTPEGLRTGRTTERITPEVKELVGALNHLASTVREREAAREALSAHGRAGGEFPPDPLDPRPSVFGPGRAGTDRTARGRLMSGDEAGPILTPDKLNELRALLRALPSEGLLARQRAASPNFNPHDRAFDQGIKGTSDLANATRLSLRALRKSTEEMDALADEYHTLRDAVAENEAFIQRATARIGTDAERGNDKERLEQAVKQIRPKLERQMSQFLAEDMQLFDLPEFQAGRNTRRNFLAQQQEARDSRDPRTFVDMAQALRQAAIGSRLSPGTTAMIRNVPGLVQTRSGFSHADGLDNKLQAKLDRLTTKLENSQSKAMRFANDPEADPERIAEANKQLEYAANAWARFVNKVFGVAPRIETFTGQAPTERKVVAQESDREARRQQLAEDARRKFRTTPQQALASYEAGAEKLPAAIEEAQAKAAAATQRRAQLAQELEQKERARMAALSEAEREEYEAQLKVAKAAETRAFRLATRLPGPRERAGLHLPVGEGPLTQAGQKFTDNMAGIRAAEDAERQARARATAVAGDDTDIRARAQALQEAQTAERLATEGLDALKVQLEQTVAAAARLREQIATVKSLAEGGATRKDIAAQTGLKADQIRDILGPYQRGKKAEAAATSELVAEINADVAALKKERAALQAGPHSGKDIKALRESGASEADVQAARDAKRRLNEIRKALDGAGGAGGGGKIPTANGGAGGAGGGDESILRQILQTLNGIHATIRGGVRVTGAAPGAGTGGTRTTRASSARIAELAAASGDDEAAALKAIAAQRKREERLRPSDIDRAHGQALAEEARRQKEVAESAKATAAARQAEANATIQLNQAMALLSDSTKVQIAELDRLVKEGRDDLAIVEQRARVYNAIGKDLRAAGVQGAGDQRRAAGTVLRSVGGVTSQTGVDEVARTARSLNGYKVTDEAMAQQVPAGGIFGEQSAFTRAMFGNHGFWSRVMASTGTFVVRNFTAGFVFGLTNALQDVIQKAIETESTFIKVSSALKATGRDVGSLRSDLQSISSDYGVALTDVYQTAAGLTGLFKDVGDISFATRVVAQLQMISRGALNAQEAMGTLASITSAFTQLGDAQGLGHIADVLTVIQERVGVNIETTAEGVARLSGLAQQVGLTFEQTAVFVGEIAKRTNQTGAAAGEQFSRIIAAMQSGRGREVLTKNLPNTNIENALNAREYGQAIEILMQNYEGLTKAQQDNITVGLGGQRQAAAINALLMNGAEALNTVQAATLSKGQADQRAAQISRTLNAQLEILNQNLVNFAQNIVRSGIVTAFAAVLGVTNKLFAAVNHVFSTINDITDSNALTRWAKNIGLGLLGLVATLAIVRRAFAGLKASIATMPSVQAGLTAAAEVGGTPGPLTRAGARTRDFLGGAMTKQVSFGSGGVRSELAIMQERAALGRATNGFGRALETVTAGPLNRLGRGFDALSNSFSRSAQTLYGSGTPLAGRRYDAYARGTGALGSAFTGAGGFLQQFLRGQSPVANLLSRGSESLSARASLLSSRADTGSAFATTAAARTQVAAMRAGSIAAAGTATAMTRLSAGLRVVALGGAAAQGAMMGLGIALTAMLLELQRQEQFAKDRKKAYEAVFGTDQGNAAGVRPTDYTGPSTDLINQRREDLGGVSGFMSALGQRYLHPFSSVDEIASRQAGALPDDINNDQLKVMQESFSYLRSVANNSAKTVDQVNTAQADATAAIKASLDDILSNGDLSEEQKAAAQAYYESLLKTLGKGFANARLDVEGLGKLNALTLEQLEPLNSFVQTLVNNAGAGLPGQFDHIIALMQKDLGIPDEAKLTPLLDELRAGPATTARALQIQYEVSKGIAESLQATLESMTQPDSGFSQDEIEETAKKLQDELGKLQQEQDAFLQAMVSQAQTSVSYYGGRGNLGAAEGDVNAAVEALRQASVASGVSADRRIQLRQQAAQLSADYSQQLITEATASKTADRQRSDNERRNANLEVQIAREQLRMAEQMFREGDITIQQLRQYQEALYGALLSRRQTLTQEAQARRQTTIASLPQGDQLRVSAAQVDSANKAVEEARHFGVNSTQYQGALQNAISAQQSYVDAQNAVTQAQSALGQAYANARGDSVAATQAAIKGAKAALSAAITHSGGNMQSAEVLNAQATLVGLNAQLNQDQLDLVNSRYDVSIALAEAAGNTVRAANLQLRKARQALAAALKQSGGENTAAVNQARAAAISAEASARDAKLQDQLDTIDFNMEMNRMTQGAAISALRHILKTADLTKAQRRQILLQIKGMQNAIASDGAWNFGDIKLPTPYQMRRYIKGQQQGLEKAREKVGQQFQDAYSAGQPSSGAGGGGGSNVTNNNHTVSITINAGTDVRKVEEVVKRAVGKGHRVRTAQPRRR